MPLGTETVRYRIEATTDDFGNPGEPGESRIFAGCAVYPRGASAESSDRSMTVTDGFTVLIPPEYGVPDLTAAGEYEWARQPGVWRKAVGNVAPWFYLDGGTAGTQVNLRGEAG